MASPRSAAADRRFVIAETVDLDVETSRRPRGGRPTRAAAAERDERLLEIATTMFMELGFDATSMDRLAEAASIGKATLYARYSDKAALFTAVLRRRILEVYESLEEEFAAPATDVELADVLRRVASRLIEKSLSPDAVTLGRILSAQAPKFPDLAHFAIREGYGRQCRLIETILAPYAADPRYTLDDLPLAAEMFLALVLSNARWLKIYGIAIDQAELRRRTETGIQLFVRGIRAG